MTRPILALSIFLALMHSTSASEQAAMSVCEAGQQAGLREGQPIQLRSNYRFVANHHEFLMWDEAQCKGSVIDISEYADDPSIKEFLDQRHVRCKEGALCVERADIELEGVPAYEIEGKDSLLLKTSSIQRFHWHAQKPGTPAAPR